jgi:hypothetical protein
MTNAVLIPTAKYISEDLQIELGEIPPVLIPLGGKNLIEIIIADFAHLPGKTEYYLLVNEGRAKVESWLKSNAEYDNVHLVNVNLDGDLGHTIHQGLQHIVPKQVDNLLINFGDTIVSDHFSMESDTIFYKDLEESYRWTSFEMLDGKITKITDKMLTHYLESNHIFIGLFLIKDPEKFLSYFGQKEVPTEIDSFYFNLQHYLDEHDYLISRVHKWYDLGHIDFYYEVKKHFLNTRFFNNITVEKGKPILIKRSDNPETLINEINWYLKFPAALKCYVPQILDYSTKPDDAFISMEYYGYPSLCEVFIYGHQRLDIWNRIFQAILVFLNQMQQYGIEDEEKRINLNLREMYVNKTLERISLLKDDELFAHYFNEKIIINSENYLPINHYLEIIPELFRLLITEDKHPAQVIHGDLCLANILYDNRSGNIKVLDPRGSFGDYTIHGDQCYDLAKLSHSFNGRYEMVISNYFTQSSRDNRIDYTIFWNTYNQNVTDMFNKILVKNFPNQIKAVHFIEALLFLSMVPLHKDFHGRQKIMLARGIEKLHQIIRDNNII